MRLKLIVFLLLVVCCSTLFSSLLQAAEFHGKVMGPEGTPVAGATLWVGARGLLSYSEKDGTRQRLTTGSDGTFAFTVADKTGANEPDANKPDANKPGVLKAPVFAFARVQAEKFALCDVLLISGDNPIKLNAVKGMRGVVKNVSGVRVAGARIITISAWGGRNLNRAAVYEYNKLLYYSAAYWSAALPPVETRSDAEGNWSLASVSKGVVGLRDPRFANVGVFVGSAGEPPMYFASEEVTITAKPAASLTGRIVTPDGKPVAGAFVEDFRISMVPPVRTDKNGVFNLTGLIVDPTVLEAYTQNDQWVLPYLLVPRLAANTINQAPPWKAIHGVMITGQLVDENSGKPVAGAKVDGPLLTPKITDAQGRFYFRSQPFPFFLDISHPDFASIKIRFTNIEDKPAYNLGRLTLQHPITVWGRLLDDKDQPLNDEIVIVKMPLKVVSLSNQNSKEPPLSYKVTEGQTNQDGTLGLNLAPGSYTVSLQSRKWELSPQPEIKFEVGEKMKPLELRAKKVEK